MEILSDFKKALKRIASLLPVIPKSRPMYPRNSAITILRIFLWLMPAFIIPVAVYLGFTLNRFLPFSACVSLSILLLITATAGIGLFEQFLTFQEIKMPLPYSGTVPCCTKEELVRLTIIFVLAQFFIAPILLIIACSVAGAVAKLVF